MQIITDLQIHSKYSRAVSQQMIIPQIWQWAKTKGIGLMATGDWTHPLWMREIKANLEEDGSGLLRIKNSESRIQNENEDINKKWSDEANRNGYDPRFLLATEVSCIYSQGGKGRRIHTLIWVPSIDSADKIIKKFNDRGCNLLSDGRPIIGLTSIEVADIVLSTDPNALVIPAHAWTPWFSLYGSQSGFDSIDECFGPFAKNIYAIETGLSSDPSMNWRITELDNRAILSFSDAHSGPKLGREATVFDLNELSYKSLREAITGEGLGSRFEALEKNENNNNPKSLEPKTYNLRPRIAYTIEFYPEEGKYHYTGHRNCMVKQMPSETKQKGEICPVCGRKLTIGVMHRVEQLAGRSEEELKISNFNYKLANGTDVQMIKSNAFPDRPPYVKLVPLQEIISEVLGTMPATQRVQDEYKKLVDNFGSEFAVLLNTKLSDITKCSGEKISEAIHKVRTGDIYIDPGYDGVFGKVKIWGEEKKKEEQEKKEQMSLF